MQLKLATNGSVSEGSSLCLRGAPWRQRLEPSLTSPHDKTGNRVHKKSIIKICGMLGAAIFLAICSAADATDATPSPSPGGTVESDVDSKLSLKGKTIGITVIGTVITCPRTLSFRRFW